VLIDESGHARLADFGLTMMLNMTRTIGKTQGAGSLRWMAPELLDPDAYEIPETEAGITTKQSDIYALAITIWEVMSHYGFSTMLTLHSIYIYIQIYSGEIPFGNMRDVTIYKTVLGGARPPYPQKDTAAILTLEMWSCMEGWWNPNPLLRQLSLPGSIDVEEEYEHGA
jgi:serine/threonine protein kinase